MPFDPDAYLASKSAPASFDPDAYLASKGAKDAPAPPKPPERSTWENVKDALATPRDVMLSAASGAVAAPIANVAGLAATGYEALAHGGKGDGEMPGKFRDDVRDRLTYHPDNPLLKQAARVIAPGMQAVGNVGSAIKDFAKGGASDDSLRGMAVNAGSEALVQAPGFIGIKAPAIARAAGELPVVQTLRGVPATAARGEAVGGIRSTLEDVASAHGRTESAKLAEAGSLDARGAQAEAAARREAAGHISEAHVYEDAAVRTQRELDAQRARTGVPTADALGGQVRDGYLKVMTDAKAAREAAVDPLYAKAKAAAAAREAQGQFIDVKPAVKDLDEMLKLSENLPDLHAKLMKLRQSVEAAPAKGAPPPPSIVDVNGKPLTAPISTTRPLSYAELDMASRYVKDIAFSGEAEGYGALIRNTAKRLSVKLDEQISKAVPEHAAATAKYRELSEPMETLGTRIGAALHDTEGGLKGDAYAKVSPQDIPARVFGKRDRVEQLVDALAGGKKASPEARAAAQAKVDTWVENWILDKSRGKAPAVSAPGMDAALNAAPGARAGLERAAQSEGAHEVRVPELTRGAEASRKAADDALKRGSSAAGEARKSADAVRREAEAAAGARAKVQAALQDARALEQGSSEKMKKQAFDKYVEAFRQSMDPADPRYRAGIALIDRAASLEEKTARARKLALGVAGAVGVAGAAHIGVQVPGVFK